ncbi:MAG TPA: DUF58 domain-containing protein [Candidatus Nanoarchaeia archaeon]|nr:DUF58 domain-containing protein [Candidatus Nanoarchaeia archaeon]
MISTDFLRELDRFTFSARKRVSSQYTGARRSTKVGRGTDAYGFREYEMGDDFRTIDWRVYARSEKLYVRQFEEYKDMTTHILLDVSGSMDYPPEGMKKFDFATMLAVGFAYIVMKENEKFAISTFSNEIDISRSGRGRINLMETIDQLNAIQPHGNTGFWNSIDHYSSLIKSKSRVIIISDFLVPLDDIRQALFRMGRHDLIVIQVLDPSEIELSTLGAVKLHDLETSEQLFTDINKVLVSEHKEELESHISAVKIECNRLDADFFSFRTDLPIFEAIYRTIHGR